MNRIAWYLTARRNIALPGVEKSTHCLPVPASAPHWGPTDLKLSPEDGDSSITQLSERDLSLCMQLAFI